MTKDILYPEEKKESDMERMRKKFEELHKQNKKEKEEFCDCYNVCPNCGRKKRQSWKDILA
jgi:hypothetical protein